MKNVDENFVYDSGKGWLGETAAARKVGKGRIVSVAERRPHDNRCAFSEPLPQPLGLNVIRRQGKVPTMGLGGGTDGQNRAGALRKLPLDLRPSRICNLYSPARRIGRRWRRYGQCKRCCGVKLRYGMLPQ